MEVIVKLVNGAQESRQITIELEEGWKTGTALTRIELCGDCLQQVNSIGCPERIRDRQQTEEMGGNRLQIEVKPFSVTVLRIPAQSKP